MKHPKIKMNKERQRIKYSSVQYQRRKRAFYEEQDIVYLRERLKDLKRWDKQRRALWVKYGKWNENIANTGEYGAITVTSTLSSLTKIKATKCGSMMALVPSPTAVSLSGIQVPLMYHWGNLNSRETDRCR